MSLERFNKIQEFIDTLQEVYDEYKRDFSIPAESDVTIQLNPDQIQTMKDLFVDAMQKADIANERDNYKRYQDLYENIFFQVAAERLI